MQDEGQWHREMRSRNLELDQGSGKYRPRGGEKELDSRYVVQALDAPSQKEIAAAVGESQLLKKLAEDYLKTGIDQFQYPIVMDAANRNLMQIYLQERPDLILVRKIGRAHV